MKDYRTYQDVLDDPANSCPECRNTPCRFDVRFNYRKIPSMGSANVEMVPLSRTITLECCSCGHVYGRTEKL